MFQPEDGWSSLDFRREVPETAPKTQFQKNFTFFSRKSFDIDTAKSGSNSVQSQIPFFVFFGRFTFKTASNKSKNTSKQWYSTAPKVFDSLSSTYFAIFIGLRFLFAKFCSETPPSAIFLPTILSWGGGRCRTQRYGARN